jgi:hypothetical protein
VVEKAAQFMVANKQWERERDGCSLILFEDIP